jgi:hypothetical protein
MPGDRFEGLAELSLFNLRDALAAMEEDVSSCALKFKEILKRAYLAGPLGADAPNEANVQTVTPKRHGPSSCLTNSSIPPKTRKKSNPNSQ